MASTLEKMSEAAAHGKEAFPKLITTLKNSSVASKVLFALFLTALEKLIDVEFACPCDPKWNALYTSVCFIAPGLAATVLLLLIQGCKNQEHRKPSYLLLFGPVPAMMWLVLVFLDGQYYACTKTYWSGRFVVIDRAHPQRWCEPTNSTFFMERMTETQMWYAHSQVIGVMIILVYLVPLGIFKACKMCKKESKPPEEPAQEEESQRL